jgi:hypothetical protein
MNFSFLLIAYSIGIGVISDHLVLPVLKKRLRPHMDDRTSHLLSWATSNTLQSALMCKLNQRIGRTFDQFILLMGICSTAAPIMRVANLALDELGSYLLSKTRRKAPPGKLTYVVDQGETFA